MVDEAHCVSDWPPSIFRPDRRRLTRLVESIRADVPVLCATATATDRVVADVVEQLAEGLQLLRLAAT